MSLGNVFIEAGCDEISGRVTEINKRLEEVRLSVRELQPKGDGSVILELRNCGKGCSGCPHPQWKLWKHAFRKGRTRYLAFRIKEPWKHVKTTGDYQQNSELVKQLVSEAWELSNEREKILRSFKNAVLSCRKR